ncbi:polyhomeotic-like protein 1 [Eucyclogobius newberryi]|uniref:polyhomeotic-like protein 1 n=1 Tax=Eucyclogobius newberryi TaxID=166745 RepID=UPI003B59C6A4
METDGDQQRAPTNGSAASGASSRPSAMNSMSLYERQAVQALQALQRQPNAAQYFQQLMLQQQINNAQLQNLAAVQQVKAGATSGSGSAPSSSSRPINASATSTISQSVLFSGAAGGQGQMYLRVNRSLRAPISPQLIFMPSSTATATVATVAQQPPPQQQNQEANAHAQDNEQAQNLAIRSAPKAVGVKTEAPERGDSAPFSLVQPSHQPMPQSPSKPVQSHIKIPTYPAPNSLKAQTTSSSTAGSSSSSSASSIPLSQLLLHGPRTLASSGPAAAHILVQTSGSQTHGYKATIKPAVNAQTLVVQPLQKSGDGPHLLSAQLHARQPLQKGASGSDKSGNGPVPIQPKTLQGLRLPLQLPSRNPPPILPAPPTSTGSSSSSSHQAPHIPVQIVGARPSTLGNTQALALARSSCNPDGTPALSGSSGLLTMVASIASRESGAAGRGAGLKTLRAQKETPPPAQVSQVHPQANQSAGQNGHAAPSPAPPSQKCSASPALSRLSAATDEQRAVTNGESARSHGPQGKQSANSLKRKSDSNSAHDEDGPPPPRLQPIRDHNSALQTNQKETGPASSPRPAPVTPVLSVSRGCGQSERGPPPQAVVKPSILTHLIEGFVIQEGAEPFPVCGPVKDPSGEELANDSLENDQSQATASVLKCEYCKNFAPESQFRGTKRFCSTTCAKRYNVSFRQTFSRQSHAQNQDRTKDQDRDRARERERERSNSEDDGGTVRRRVPRRTSSEIASAKIAGRAAQDKCGSESSRSEEESSAEDDEDDPMSLSPASSASCHQAPPPPPPQATPPPSQAPPPVQSQPSAPSCPVSSPGQWSVQEVSQFISSLQGCEDLAPQFLSQEIDGQALLLLKEEHLMSTMSMKLGPALKICAHINNLRD